MLVSRMELHTATHSLQIHDWASDSEGMSLRERPALFLQKEHFRDAFKRVGTTNSLQAQLYLDPESVVAKWLSVNILIAVES